MSSTPDPISAPLPVLPGQRRRSSWWALPFVLSLLFVVAVGAWLEWSDGQELEAQRRTLISDALSLESSISARIDNEHGQLMLLARNISNTGPTELNRHAQLSDGLRRLWMSLTWLDAQGRIVAHLPEPSPQPERAPRAAGIDEGGLSAHLVADIKVPGGPDRGRLVVRYAPTTLLRQSVPWWLARKYEVRLVDGLGQNIASTGESPVAAGRQTYRVSLEPALPDAYLELTVRDRHVPWWRTLPLALMVVFIALVGGATVMLRRQVNEVSRAEAAWRTEAAWRRAMEDSLTVGLRARDTRGRLVYVNPAFCEQVGYSAEELVGRAPPMPYWPPDAVEESLSRMQRNLAGGAPREGYEARWLRRDGQTIDVMIFEARLVDALGRHIGWMGSTLDISERKRLAERERHQTEAAAAQARLTMLGEVASALAHQLNQPLTAIAGYNAGVLRSLERDGYGNELVLDAVRRLGEQAAEAGRIVQRIREFLTRRSPQREHCDLAAVARRAAALLLRDFERQRVTLDWSIAAPLPPVLADPVLIEQVIINLLRNACDEMASADCAQRRIRIGLVASGDDFVRLDVDDAGPGLQGRRVEQLCAPFYSTKADGMGMGLAICRSVIEAHVGAFDAGVGVLGGARFAFTLPVAVATVTESEELK
jgi:two-component system sensor histidine kinase DctS